MATEINIPKLGMSMKDAALTEWKLNEGDWVEKGAVVLMIETEKTQWEVEALSAGFLHILIPAANGQKQLVGAVVGQLADSEEELKALQAESGVVAAPAAAAKSKPAAPATVSGGKGGRVRVSPVAKKMAEEAGIDLNTVVATGPGGRITKADVEAAIEAGPVLPAIPSLTATDWSGETLDGKRVKETISLRSGIRKYIADHMHQSLMNSAQLTMMGEIDMTEVKRLRAELLKQEASLQTRVTYTDIVVMAVTRALQDNPIMNSSLIGDEIKIWEDIHIGVAVAIIGKSYLEGGLMVPVVRNADQKSLPQISRELKGLIQAARTGTVKPDDIMGSTFTITNLGSAGGSYGFGTPIINQPESAILATSAIVERPVVKNGEIVIGSIMPFSLTIDHRVIDGAPAALFLDRLIQLLEFPALIGCL